MKILEKHDNEVKDLKKDVEDELRVNMTYSKCKRVRRMIFDLYLRFFTFGYSKLEAYVEERLRYNLQRQSFNGSF